MQIYPCKVDRKMIARFILKIGNTEKIKKEHIFNNRIQNRAGCQSTPLCRATNSYKSVLSGKRLLIFWAFDRKMIARVRIKNRKQFFLKEHIC